MITQFIGFVAAMLTTVSFVPQTFKTLRTRSTSDLSPLMYALFCSGVFGWLLYGIFKHDLPIILANLITFVLAALIMYTIVKRRKVCAINYIGIYTFNIDKMKSFYTEKFAASASGIYHESEDESKYCLLTFGSGTKLKLINIKDFAKDTRIPKPVNISISVGSVNYIRHFARILEKENIIIKYKNGSNDDRPIELTFKDPDGNLIKIKK